MEKPRNKLGINKGNLITGKKYRAKTNKRYNGTLNRIECLTPKRAEYLAAIGLLMAKAKEKKIKKIKV